MKKLTSILALILALAMVSCLCACTDSGSGSGTADPTSEPTGETGDKDPVPSGDSQPTAPDGSEPGVTDQTEPTEPPVTNYTHTIKVVDTEGNPVVGAFVQFCNDELCFGPFQTGEDGVAGAKLNGVITKAQFNVAPGYTLVGEEVVYLTEGQTEVVFTVSKDA